MAVSSKRRWVPLTHRVVGLRPIAEAPQDGREVLCTDGVLWRVCVQKEFAPDIWEFARHECAGITHTWSMAPTHFLLLEDLPQASK